MNVRWDDGDTVLQPGLWYPEVGRDRWHRRGELAPQREMWAGRDGPGEFAPAMMDGLGADGRNTLLGVLGADLGAARRDGLFYTNALERLKNDPRDATADAVVDDMATWGFLSADLPPTAGGPPPHESPRPWRKVLDWLFRSVAGTERFVLNVVATLTNFLRDMGLSAIALTVSFPPSVGLEFPPDLFRDAAHLRAFRGFVDAMHDELSAPAFA